MSAATLRRFAISLILPAMLLFAACGSGRGGGGCAAADCCGPSAACQGPQFLYATGLDGQISIFPVDNSTGGLSFPTQVSGAPTQTLGMASIDSQFLYVSNNQAGVGQTSTIDAWSIDTSTGALTPVPGSPFSLSPLSVAAGLAGDDYSQVLYVGDAGRIDALKADATGALSPILGSPFPGATNLYLTVDPQHRFLFASDDSPPGNVLAYTIDSSTGALTAVPGSPFPTIPNFVGTTRPFQVVVDQTGSFVYTVLSGTNQVAAFSIVAPSGVLNPVPGSPFAAGNTPIALTAINNFLYVSNALDGTLSGYSINPASGVLTPLAGSPFAIHAGAITSAEKYLYTTGSGGMQAFSIDLTTGALTQVGSTIPYAGATVLVFQ